MQQEMRKADAADAERLFYQTQHHKSTEENQIVAAEHSVMKYEYLKLVKESDAATEKAKELAERVKSMEDRYSDLALESTASRGKEREYEALVSNLGASIRDRRSTDEAIKGFKESVASTANRVVRDITKGLALNGGRIDDTFGVAFEAREFLEKELVSLHGLLSTLPRAAVSKYELATSLAALLKASSPEDVQQSEERMTTELGKPISREEMKKMLGALSAASSLKISSRWKHG